MTSTTTRRRFITGAGAAGAIALAGCSGGDGGDGGSDGGDGGSDGSDGGSTGGGTETVTVASLNPMSGAYSSLGPSQRAGVELAVEQINNSDEFSYEIDPVYGDTETEAGAASQAAQQAVQEDGAEFVFGAISSSVALGLNEFAGSNEFIYFPGGAAVPITGSACNEWVFRFETNTAQVAEAFSAYTVNNLSSDVWFHIADYAYGDSVYNRVKERMQAANDSFTEVGKTESSLGSSNFGSYISQISNSDAGAVVVGMTGGDLVNFINQAADAGLTDEVAIVSGTTEFKSVRAGTGASSIGTYSGVRYDPSVDLGDNQEFVTAFQEANDDELPGNFERVGYESVRLMARGMEKAGSTDPGDVRDALSGGEFTTVLGDITLRESDHQATVPTWVAELVEGDGNRADVELLEKTDDNLPPASELGCNL
jgi:branched-chain amino acid transport system substrate-binding protein